MSIKVYLVGGAVRDSLLGIKPSEKDWVVIGSTPEQMIAEGYVPVGKHFPVYLHPQTHEEYALARFEYKTAPGHKGFSVKATPDITLEEDLKRRDLTINAMAADSSGHIIDPYGGQSDLKARILRHVSPAFSEDPLRVLRVARFRACLKIFNFSIAEETLTLMQNVSNSGELSFLPNERVWGEIEKALACNASKIFFETLWQCHAWKQLLPSLHDCLNKNSKQIFAVLDQTSTAHYSKSVQLAAFVSACSYCSEFNSKEYETILNRLGAPKAYRRMCSLTRDYLSVLPDLNELSPEKCLALFVRLNAFRNTQDFLESVRLAERIVEQFEHRKVMLNSQLSERMIASIVAIDHAALRKQTTTDQDFLEKLEQERLLKIQLILENSKNRR